MPAKAGLDTNLEGGSMQLIPGTRSVLANATLYGSSGFDGGILKYGF